MECLVPLYIKYTLFFSFFLSSFFKQYGIHVKNILENIHH